MNLTDQIKECKAKIADLEFNLAVEQAVLTRLVAMGDDDQIVIPNKSRPIITDSIVPHIQSALSAKGKPMKVAPLVKAIRQQGFHFKGKTTPKRLVSSALTRRDDLFERVERGLYKLKTEQEIVNG